MGGDSSGIFVRLFEADAALLRVVPEERRAALRRRVSVPALTPSPGPWEPPHPGDDALGLLVIEGFVVRAFDVFGRRGAELLGPGALLRPGPDDSSALIPQTGGWEILTPARIGVLDAEASATLAQVPGALPELVCRSTGRAHSLALQGAIAQINGVQARVLLCLWHLADRWGVRESSEIVVPIPLEHELIADLVSAQRSTVSRALAGIRRLGVIDRRLDGYWVLRGLPPQTAEELVLVQGAASKVMLADPGLD
jgi:CRP/FNR family transcriptional regulator, cyclic AMP receptor protein